MLLINHIPEETEEQIAKVSRELDAALSGPNGRSLALYYKEFARMLLRGLVRNRVLLLAFLAGRVGFESAKLAVESLRSIGKRGRELDQLAESVS